MTFNGNTTGPIPFDATAAKVLDEIQQLGSIGAPGNVIVTGPNGGPWDVQFVNDFREIDQPAFTADSRGLRGGVTLNIAQADGSGTNEIQSITINGATSGTFRLTFDNGAFARTTGPLFFDATPGEIESALAALTSVGAGNVRVTGPVGGPWFVEFIGDLASLDQKIILMDGTGLDTGFVIFSSTVVETTPGNPGGPTDEMQTITITPAPLLITSGDFTLSFDGETTAPIAYKARGVDVEAALESLSTIGANNVIVTGAAGGPWTVTFTRHLAKQNVAALIPAAGNLGGALGISVSDNFIAAATGTPTMVR